MKSRRAKRAWVVAVEMGYGHMRAARPLRRIAEGGAIITADDYEGIPNRDRRLWVSSRKFYHAISRLSDRGFLGKAIFNAFDYFQKIKRVGDRQIKPTFQLKQGYALIRNGWGKDLIEKLNKKPIPLVTTFFTVGQMAEVHGYKSEIYILVTDSDVSRVWAPLEAAKSRIKYLTPTKNAARHLKNYGIAPDKIFFTGFPMPSELVESAKKNLERRLKNFEAGKRITVTFAVGGAGAQANLGAEIAKGLRPLIKEGRIILNIILGTHRNFISKFKEEHNLRVFSCETKEDYFQFFDEIIAETDVLWTKPSELSFYAGLGLPIIMAPPLGSQEEKNREWLLDLGAGIDQKNPTKARRWLPKLMDSGALARAAGNGFDKIDKNAVDKISKIIL